MKISVIGLGFVGLSLASVLASKGFKVVGLDIDKTKCTQILNGTSPFFEPGMDKMLKIGLKKGLEITNNFSSIINQKSNFHLLFDTYFDGIFTY
jgi:UDP-glucose 6-dehydrogenase